MNNQMLYTERTHIQTVFDNVKKKSIRNSPMVEMNVVLKASSENRKRMQVFPTPESPISSNLNK